jgi:hypothetical protein
MAQHQHQQQQQHHQAIRCIAVVVKPELINEAKTRTGQYILASLDSMVHH